MSTSARASQRIRFGVYELDLDSLELTKSGMPVKLQPQPSRVLALLASKAGTLVTREEIRDYVWGNDTFVDVEKGLGFCLKQVRAVLNDNARTPHFIETLPRRGYRFIFPVENSSKEVKQWSAHQETAQEVVLAVLPFGNLSGDASQEYFADGMTETLIIEMARISAIRVISRTSVMQYKGLSRPLPQIAKDLHANVILEGAVARSGQRVRITAQLIDAATDRHIWAERYERELQDILDLQSEVARAIASEIRVKLTPEEEERLTTTRTVDPEAYENYLKGRFYWNKRTQAALYKSIDYFNQAIAKDPDSAPAYAGLADSYLVLGFYEDDNKVAPKDFFSKAKDAARRAVRIDDNLAEAHTSLAQLKFTYDWDREDAAREFKRAVQLNSGYANARHWHALCLAAMGRTSDAKAEIRQALHLDPLSPSIGTSVALCFYWAREYDAAIEQCRKLIATNRGYMMAHMVCALAYEQKGMIDAAIAEFKKARNCSENPAIVGGLGHLYGASGQTAQAQELLGELKSWSTKRYVSPYAMALIHLGLGQYDRALSFLTSAYRDRSGWLVYLDVEPRFDLLRAQPQFKRFRQQLKSEDSPLAAQA